MNEKASGYDVKLFTDDTGPAATAADLNVPYIMINENWRRPPAESTDQKKIKDLEKDLAIYRAQEPKISIGTCEGANEHSTLTVTRTVAEPLTDEEIEYLVKSLCLTHPLVTDFTPPPTSSTSDRSGEVKIVVYESPEEGLIAAYHDVTYPKWVGECRELLQNFHNGRGEIEPPVVLSWPMSNKGTRPASHVRIEFEATGPVELIRFPFDIHDAEESDASTATDRKDIVAFKRLPSPPTPPPFQKQVTRVPAPITTQPAQNFDLAAFADHALLQNYFGKTADFSKAFALPDLKAFKMPHLMANSAHSEIQRSLANITKSLHLPQHILDSQRRISMLEASAFRRFPDPVIEPPSIPRFELPKPRDPEAFIYDDWPAAQQVKKGTVICELWRHQAEEHTIDFMVAFLSDGEARGTVKCTVHAENLTKPEYARVIVERRVEFINMMSLAEHMIKNCR
ncbi:MULTISPECIES: hypothetical protein [Acidiphilium]|uniref:hypothetical protein n=1 Tax=Acidiphilium TaxID=522 RepID=UPI00257CFAB3|nr:MULTISPECIES: hypothetical protein [Acidiphilium]HQT85226.1 hypothetical protein [Acidiphilium rubrum]